MSNLFSTVGCPDQPVGIGAFNAFLPSFFIDPNNPNNAPIPQWFLNNAYQNSSLGYIDPYKNSVSGYKSQLGEEYDYYNYIYSYNRDPAASAQLTIIGNTNTPYTILSFSDSIDTTPKRDQFALAIENTIISPIKTMHGLFGFLLRIL